MLQSRTKSIAFLYLFAALLLYAAVTLAVAALAAPAGDKDFLHMNRTFAPLAGNVPGAEIWPSVMDLHGKLGGVFPTPLAILACLILLSMAALSRVKSIRRQMREDAATARDEAIRQRVRKHGA
ncbi:hypothetical protein LMG19083_04566 [Ralstonia psammae]|uniref:Transmembrane protein n=1 Tax=Ralstonia psammae TaxID=3058598 RepID=A0ABN9JFW7_9RALS|nr:hypothetical protein [Ralstonia sp. LMG 19083]CAJ0807459.1 hypothetical protein LMG19083_04566 [Ralstonia sp. LMG 19083]